MAINIIITLAVIALVHIENVNSQTSSVHPESLQLLVNSTVDVFCTIKPSEFKGKDSSDLFFLRRRENFRLPEHLIFRENSTTIRLHIPRAIESDSDLYQCYINLTTGLRGIGMSTVSIGHKPIEINDFKCRSYNWDNMTCTFTKPANRVPTEYRINYTTEANPSYWYQCNITYQNEKATVRTLHYMRAHEKYIFYLTMVNNLGELKQRIEVAHYANIIPAVPSGLKSSNVTSNSVAIEWEISYNLLSLYKEGKIDFVHDIRLKSQFDDDWSKIYSAIEENHSTKSSLIYGIALDDLRYPNTWYNISIRVRIDRAVDPDNMYSEAASLAFQTRSRRPDKPPTTTPGSFFINDYGEITIFWKELEVWERNGDNLHYVITEVLKNGKPTYARPYNLSNTMAKFEKLNLHSNYTFRIHSENNDGRSIAGSEIFVPMITRRTMAPMKLKKVSMDGTYNISWTPSDHPVTIFWCRPKNAQPTACEGDFDFITMDNGSYSYNLVTDTSLNFAISSNVPDRSSGMTWAMCTASQSNEIGQIKNFWVTKIEATWIEYQWKLECEDKPIVQGFHLMYCPIKPPFVTPKAQECNGPEMRINITSGNVLKYNITDLKPFTMYKTVISMFSDSREGPRSRPMENLTLEAAPSPPRDFKAYDVRNTSMMLQWRVPEHINGVLMSYEVFYNGAKVSVNKVKNESSGEPLEYINYRLENLTSFTKYELLVKACTGECSENSNKDRKKTAIGFPGRSAQPITKVNNSMVEIGWFEPAIKSGYIDFYEIKTVILKGGQKMGEKIVRVCGNRTKCRRAPLCRDGGDIYEFSIRAVNVVFSPHAEDTNLTCSSYAVHLRQLDGVSAQPYVSSFPPDQQLHEVHRVRHHHQNCEEEVDIDLKNFLARDPYADYLEGEWSESAISNCFRTNSFELRTIITIFLSVMLMVCMLYMSYKFYIKIKDMKNIVIILPPGLEDITKEIKPSDLENKKLPNLGMINDASIFADEEEDQLLRRRTETNSSSRSDLSRSQTESPDDIAEDVTYDAQQLMEDDTHSADSVSTDQLKGSINSFTNIENRAPIPAVTSTPNNRFPLMSNGYVRPSMVSPSGYVQAGTMSIVRPTTSNAYVPINQLGRPILNAIPPENSVDLNNVKLSMKTPIVTSTDAISGYVTHKQLSDFGHKMQ